MALYFVALWYITMKRTHLLQIPFSLFSDLVKEKIRTLINTQPVRQELNSVDTKVKRFYQSCMALEYIEADKEKPLKKIISSLGIH